MEIKGIQIKNNNGKSIQYYLNKAELPKEWMPRIEQFDSRLEPRKNK